MDKHCPGCHANRRGHGARPTAYPRTMIFGGSSRPNGMWW